MYGYKVFPQETKVRNRPPLPILKDPGFERDMFVKTYHRGDESVQGEGGICLKETSRDEKQKNMAASHWTDTTGQLCSFYL